MSEIFQNNPKFQQETIRMLTKMMNAPDDSVKPSIFVDWAKEKAPHSHKVCPVYKVSKDGKNLCNVYDTVDEGPKLTVNGTIMPFGPTAVYPLLEIAKEKYSKQIAFSRQLETKHKRDIEERKQHEIVDFLKQFEK